MRTVLLLVFIVVVICILAGFGVVIMDNDLPGFTRPLTPETEGPPVKERH